MRGLTEGGPHTSPHANHRVLLVEDHDDSRLGIAEVLTVHGFDVVAVEHARAGLDVLRVDPGPWCVVVLDWRMPGMTGGDFLAHLRRDLTHGDLPVVVCSGDGVTPGAVAEHGVKVIIAKPVDPDTLVTVVQRECATRHLARGR